jgi:hypothetical protein
MSDVDLGKLHDVEAELARLGLLLQHDRTLPSVTARVAGAPIAGSWWGHARGPEIYDLLVAFEAGAGALAAKLVNGKVTFVHERLWSALLTLVASPRIIERASLSARAQRLLEHVQERSCVRPAELRGAGFGSGQELKKLLTELESNILVHTSSEHTPSGAHEKVLRSWSDWVRARAFTPTPMTHELASSQLAAAASALGAGTRQSVRFPWAPSPC